jgi:hypothetical protein
MIKLINLRIFLPNLNAIKVNFEIFSLQRGPSPWNHLLEGLIG